MTPPTSPQALARALLAAAEKAETGECHIGDRIITDFALAKERYDEVASPSNLTALVTWALEMEEALKAEKYQREATERDRDDARVQRMGAEGAAEDLLAAIGDWARPTGANGMVSAAENHPLMVAARRARQSLRSAIAGKQP